jgi:hypothetical protein
LAGFDPKKRAATQYTSPPDRSPPNSVTKSLCKGIASKVPAAKERVIAIRPLVCPKIDLVYASTVQKIATMPIGERENSNSVLTAAGI